MFLDNKMLIVDIDTDQLVTPGEVCYVMLHPGA